MRKNDGYAAQIVGLREIDRVAARIVADFGLPQPPSRIPRGWLNSKHIGGLRVDRAIIETGELADFLRDRMDGRLSNQPRYLAIMWAATDGTGSLTLALRLKTSPRGIKLSLFCNGRWRRTSVPNYGPLPSAAVRMVERFETERAAQVLAGS